MNNLSKAILRRIEPLIETGKYTQMWALLDTALRAFPDNTVELFALSYTVSQMLPDKSRYAQYQSRYFDFGIKPDSKVLDMGSGHIPFPLATHLADISTTDHTVGRAGEPFKSVDGKPVYECSVEATPFKDREFDFVYCSHVLEHVHNPEAACRELMRIGKRGYIECPTRGKDVFFATAKVSNHLWAVECLNGELIFTEYSPSDALGVGCDILLDMNCNPQTLREKAVAGLDVIKAASLNTMLLWEESFAFSVHRQQEWPQNVYGPKPPFDVSEIRIDLKNLQKLTVHSPLYGVINKIRSKLARLLLHGEN